MRSVNFETLLSTTDFETQVTPLQSQRGPLAKNGLLNALLYPVYLSGIYALIIIYLS